MGKPFVMAEIQISFRAVIEHVDFAVLKRAHCAGIHIEMGSNFCSATLRPRASSRVPRRRPLVPYRGNSLRRLSKNVFHLLSNASTRCTSSGTSTPMASYSTGRTAISMPFSSAVIAPTARLAPAGKEESPPTAAVPRTGIRKCPDASKTERPATAVRDSPRPDRARTESCAAKI